LKLRLILPGLLWLGMMILLFVTPTKHPETVYFDGIPARSLIHSILFFVFVMTWMIAFKKQRSGQKIDRYTIPIILTVVALIMVISEVLGIAVGNGFRTINFLFDGIGAVFGLSVFALLYRTK